MTDYGLNPFKPNTGACISWLSGKPKSSVVYVSFGNMAELDVEQMRELAWGLKRSNCYFLVGCEGIRGDQATAQFHRGDFGEGFGGELVPSIGGAVSFNRLLSHPLRL